MDVIEFLQFIEKGAKVDLDTVKGGQQHCIFFLFQLLLQKSTISILFQPCVVSIWRIIKFRYYIPIDLIDGAFELCEKDQNTIKARTKKINATYIFVEGTHFLCKIIHLGMITADSAAVLFELHVQ